MGVSVANAVVSGGWVLVFFEICECHADLRFRPVLGSSDRKHQYQINIAKEHNINSRDLTQVNMADGFNSEAMC